MFLQGGGGGGGGGGDYSLQIRTKSGVHSPIVKFVRLCPPPPPPPLMHFYKTRPSMQIFNACMKSGNYLHEAITYRLTAVCLSLLNCIQGEKVGITVNAHLNFSAGGQPPNFEPSARFHGEQLRLQRFIYSHRLCTDFLILNTEKAMGINQSLKLHTSRLR